MNDNKESGSVVNQEKFQRSTSDFNKIFGKSILVSPNEEQFDLLQKRLRQQLDEGRGEVIIEV